MTARLLRQQALVWRAPVSGARRRFSRRAAYREWARVLIRAKYRDCGCEPDVGYTCALHRDDGRFEGGVGQWPLMLDRLARWLEWRDRRGER